MRQRGDQKEENNKMYRRRRSMESSSKERSVVACNVRMMYPVVFWLHTAEPKPCTTLKGKVQVRLG